MADLCRSGREKVGGGQALVLVVCGGLVWWCVRRAQGMDRGKGRKCTARG
jgi:hypothetical protein